MKVFSKILIANRGEIAVRIIRTARKMGISTVAIHAAEERHALHVRMADEAYELHGTSLAETYLNIDQIISIVKKTGTPAIHPGYGFLSENEIFAAACENSGIIFIGPHSDSISLMGNKTLARESVRKAGIPIIEGYTGSFDELIGIRDQIKFPVLIKAAAGGGGKGMRLVFSPKNIREGIESAAREAQAYFGNNSVYLEQYIEDPRHIEVQLLADNHGNIIHLCERECSIQRRYQKIIEESPSPFVNSKMRKEIGEAAIKIAREINYRNAGTIEFLADQKGNFYFLEMNTRIQVEHPVTEAVTNLDIVQEQIMIAAGKKLPYTQDQIIIRGHAIECRICSEDPSADFIPSPGKMTCYIEPEGEGIRVDSAYDHEAEITGNYDPLISKVIVAGKDREEARTRMILALGEYGLHGLNTNIGLLLSILHSDVFIDSSFSTTYLNQNINSILEDAEKIKSRHVWKVPALAALVASLHRKAGKNFIWDELGYWRLNKISKFFFEGEIMETRIIKITDDYFELILNNEESGGRFIYDKKVFKIEFDNDYHKVFISENNDGQFLVTYKGFEYIFRRFDFLKKNDFFIPVETDSITFPGEIYSPVPGRIIKVNNNTGDSVKKGDILIIVESMKMENSIKAPADGIIENIGVKEGELIDGSLPLLLISLT